jgi:hypothetical protein
LKNLFFFSSILISCVGKKTQICEGFQF